MIKDTDSQKQDQRNLDIVAAAQKPAGQLPPALQLSVAQLMEVERMAAQGMNLAQIAKRLRIEPTIFEIIAERNSELHKAYDEGVARGQDQVTGALLREATAGNVPAARLYLERIGGPQWRPPAAQPAVVVTAPGISVDAAGSIAQALERQRELLSEPIDAEYVELKRED